MPSSRTLQVALLAASVLAACGVAGGAATNAGRRAGPPGAPAVIVLDSTMPPIARVVWLAGLPAVRHGDAQVVSDGSGGWLALDHELRPTALPAGLEVRPYASLAGAPDGPLWGMTGAGELTRLPTGGTVSSRIPLGDAVVDPVTHAVWIVRSAARFTYRMPGETLPLFERHDPVTGAVRAVGQAWLPEHGLLQDLANAGHLVVRGDTMFYAPFIRDELLALSLTGDTLWRFTRGFGNTTVEPRFELKDGRPVIDYHPINLGLAFGPTGTLLLLGTADGSVTAGRLDELDPATGRLLATADLPTATPTIAVAPNGRVHLLSAAALLATAPPRHLDVPDVTLLWLQDSTPQRLRELQGAPIILNFWASWCGPCRKELPALDSLRLVLARESIRVIGMNDDRDPNMARAFLAKIAPGFPSLAGGGALQAQFGYVGLPWTVLLDRQGAVVGQWVGELDGAALRRLAAAARAVAVATPAPGSRSGHMHH